VTCASVVDKSVPNEHANSIFQIKVKWKYVIRLYRHTILKVLNEIHRWTLKIWAACFSETTIKIFSAIKNGVVYLIILPVTQTKVPGK